MKILNNFKKIFGISDKTIILKNNIIIKYKTYFNKTIIEVFFKYPTKEKTIFLKKYYVDTKDFKNELKKIVRIYENI